SQVIALSPPKTTCFPRRAKTPPEPRDFAESTCLPSELPLRSAWPRINRPNIQPANIDIPKRFHRRAFSWLTQFRAVPFNLVESILSVRNFSDRLAPLCRVSPCSLSEVPHFCLRACNIIASSRPAGPAAVTCLDDIGTTHAKLFGKCSSQLLVPSANHSSPL